jgi:hypothetical protein
MKSQWPAFCRLELSLKGLIVRQKEKYMNETIAKQNRSAWYKMIAGSTLVLALLSVAGCEKEYSLEEGGNGTGVNIIGDDCRISKISYADSASGVSLGAITANINSSDRLTSVVEFDSLNNTLLNEYTPLYTNDTVYISFTEYFVLNPTTKAVMSRHGQLDPTDPFSDDIVVDYTYNAQGYLTKKEYSYEATGIIYRVVDYLYIGGNLVRMEDMDPTTGELSTDADLRYTSLAPTAFVYFFPDELDYQEFNQFLNFGRKSVNAVSNITVRSYDPVTNTPADSIVSAFKGYVLSADKYVLSCYMDGDDQSSLPAVAGKLVFSYHCR